MLKSIRTFALVSALSLTAVSTLSAETWGCNPKPRPGASTRQTMDALVIVVSLYLGL